MLWKFSKAGSKILNLTRYTLHLDEKGSHRNALASLVCSSHALHIVGDDKGLSLWLNVFKNQISWVETQICREKLAIALITLNY